MKITSIDGITRKYLYPVRDDLFVETTYVDYHNKHIVCFSSMIGCPINCAFCSSGYRETIGILSATEIIDQCEYVINQERIGSDKAILFSCMGEGEPFLNYQNVVEALKELTNQYPTSKVSISTTGIKPHLIERLAREEFQVPVKLQVSIHCVDDNVRSEMIPVASSLERIRKALDVFKLTDKTLELNYVLFNLVNDGIDDAKRLAEFADGVMIKLNRYNVIPECGYQASRQAKRFIDMLEQCNAPYEIYETDGYDIGASCGQLTYKRK